MAVGRRYFGYGELPLVCLALLDQRPRSAYELMGELARLFGPAYRPSPGGVYPALRALVDEALVEEAPTSAAATTYRVTGRGARALVDRRDDLAAIEHRTGRQVVAEEELDGVLARVGARVRALAGRLPHSEIVVQLDAALSRLEDAATVSTGGER